MANGLNFLSSSSSVGRWTRRCLKVFAIFFLLFGSYRLIQWLRSPAPDVYKIGMDSSWYPLAFYGKEYSVTAFSADLIFSIARNQNIQIEIVRAGHNRLMELLDDHKVEGILSSILPQGKLEETYYFSDPYYRYGAVLVISKSSAITSMNELPRKRVGVKRSSPVLYRLKIDPQATIIPYDSPLSMLQDVSTGKLDAALMDQLLLYLYFGALYSNQIKVATLPMTNEGLRLVTLQNSNAEDLISMFNTGLNNMKENGTYDRLLNQWELYDPEKILQ